MKRLLALVLAGLMAVSVTACSGSASSSQSGSASGQTSQSGKTGIDMKFWIFLNPDATSDPRSAVLKGIVDDYNKNNKYGNKVTVESINYSKFESQAIQAAAAGTGPDIINIYTDMLKKHISGGTVQPMTAMATDFIKTMPDYLYKADNLKINNEIYTLPWETRTFTYWYRSDIYSSVPKTWDELISTAAPKTSGATLGFTFGLSEGGNGAGFMESFNPLLEAAGGSLLDGSGKAAFNSDAGVKVLNMMKTMVSKKVMNNSALSMTVDDVQSGLISGSVDSCVLGTQRAASISKSSFSSKIKSAPIPGFTAGTTAPAIVAGQSLGIGKYAQNPEMAFDFIKTFYTTDNQKKWMQANVMTVRNSLYDDADVNKMSNYADLKSWSDYAAKGTVIFYPANYTELSTKLVQVAQQVVYQNADAKTQLDSVATWYNNTAG